MPADLEAWFPVVIETPRGSRVKYEVDRATGLLRLDRVLASAVYYPANYGFVPRTCGADGGPLDVLVLCQEEIVPGALLRGRAIGVLRIREDQGQDDKVIAVHEDDPEYTAYQHLIELPQHRLRELRRFFLDYLTLEDKEVLVESFLGPAEAKALLRAAVLRYSREEAALRQATPGH